MSLLDDSSAATYPVCARTAIACNMRVRQEVLQRLMMGTEALPG